MALIEVRLRPLGPWRVGHGSGDRERVETIYRSDALYSAITHAMRVLGWMDEWLDATARADGAPVARFSSLFPFVGKTRLVTPPRSSWPPPSSGKLYLHGMKLVPLEIARGGPVDDSRWSPDGATECLIPSGANPPFQVSVRSAAAVDRLTGASEPHRTACLEFGSNAGWWGLFDAADANWESRIRAAFRLLADTGFGGERSRGWGRSAEPTFSSASHLFPEVQSNGELWLLSLFSPHESDAVDWSKGDYTAVVRGGWTESPAGAASKKSVRMIGEGSVLAAESLRGRTVDVAPEGFAHPVYRSGIALAVALGVPPAPVVEEPAPPPVDIPAEESAPAPEEEVAGEPVPRDEEQVSPPEVETPGESAQDAAADGLPVAMEGAVEEPPAEEPLVAEEPPATEEPRAAEEPLALEEPPVAEEPPAAEKPSVAEEPPVAEEPRATGETPAAEEPPSEETPE
jgi:CRISPR/Cas system CSM-associated protein Csm4 (group 5 of RAMP superfamily)